MHNPFEISASLIIPNYNGAAILLRCLECIYKQKRVDIEIIVVDDCSTDCSLEILEPEVRSGRIKLVKNEKNVGFAGSCAAGVRNSRFEYIFFVNSDAFFIDEEDVYKTAFFLKEQKDVGVASLYQKYEDGTPQFIGSNVDLFLMLDPEASQEKKMSEITNRQEETHDVFMAGGACFGMRKVVYDLVGGFDESYFLYVEELDLMWRVQIAGFRVLTLTHLPIIHLAGVSTGNLPNRVSNSTNCNKIFLRERNTLMTMIKNYQLRTLCIVLPLHLCHNIFECLFLILRGKNKHMRAYLRAWMSMTKQFPDLLERRRFVNQYRKREDKWFFKKKNIVVRLYKIKYVLCKGMPKFNP